MRAVGIGFDEPSASYIIADSYGMIGQLSYEDFFTAVSFRNEGLPQLVKEKYPMHMMIRFSPQ